FAFLLMAPRAPNAPRFSTFTGGGALGMGCFTSMGNLLTFATTFGVLKIFGFTFTISCFRGSGFFSATLGAGVGRGVGFGLGFSINKRAYLSGTFLIFGTFSSFGAAMIIMNARKKCKTAELKM